MQRAARDRAVAVEPVPVLEDVDDVVVEDAQHAMKAAVRAAARKQKRVGEELEIAVHDARAVGVSWHQIGLLTGLTAEGARYRWGR